MVKCRSLFKIERKTLENIKMFTLLSVQSGYSPFFEDLYQVSEILQQQGAIYNC